MSEAAKESLSSILSKIENEIPDIFKEKEAIVSMVDMDMKLETVRVA
jgi:hypothetical protein